MYAFYSYKLVTHSMATLLPLREINCPIQQVYEMFIELAHKDF